MLWKREELNHYRDLCNQSKFPKNHFTISHIALRLPMIITCILMPMKSVTNAESRGKLQDVLSIYGKPKRIVMVLILRIQLFRNSRVTEIVSIISLSQMYTEETVNLNGTYGAVRNMLRIGTEMKSEFLSGLFKNQLALNSIILKLTNSSPLQLLLGI